MTSRLFTRAFGILAVAGAAYPALAWQASQPPATQTPVATPPASSTPKTPDARDADDVGDDSFISDQAIRKHKAELERELRKLRLKHFGTIKKPEIRQEGIALLRTYNDPIVFPALVKIFERERHDVRIAILDMLKDHASEEGDTTLAWIAAFDRDAEIRQGAIERFKARTGGKIPDRVRFMILQALRSNSDEKMNGAAEFAESLKLFDAIPWLISAQFGGPGSGGGSGGVSEPRGDLAYIVIGNQTAFVSDLTPIVADSAVAFDPTLSTLTTGVILRIQDAVVTTYRTVIQTVLVRMSTEAWGQSTEGLGYDGGKWWNWYRQDYLPALGAKLASDTQETPTPAAPAPDQPPASPVR